MRVGSGSLANAMGTYRVRTGNLGLWRQVKGQRGALEAAGVVVGGLKRGREAATNAEDRPGHAQKRTKGARRGRRGVVRLSARERDSTKSRKSVGALVSEVTLGNHMRGREQQSHEAGDLSTGRQVDARFVRFCLVLSARGRGQRAADATGADGAQTGSRGAPGSSRKGNWQEQASSKGSRRAGTRTRVTGRRSVTGQLGSSWRTGGRQGEKKIVRGRTERPTEMGLAREDAVKIGPQAQSKQTPARRKENREAHRTRRVRLMQKDGWRRWGSRGRETSR